MIFYTYAYFRPTGIPLYIGKGFAERWLDHLKTAQRAIQTGKLPKGCNPKFIRILMKALRAGEPIPIIKLQTGLTNEQAIRNEIALIAAIGREAHGGPLVNLTDGGQGMTGYAMPEEIRAKLRAFRTGRPMPPETRMKISLATKGKPKPETMGAKISAIQKGRPHSAERRANISAAKTGKKLSIPRGPLSAEVRENLRQKNLGKKPSLETRQKMSAARLGKRRGPMSAETKAKLSKARRGKSLSSAHREKISAGLRSHYSPDQGTFSWASPQV
jgi:hypothetical protein